jgi:tripartite motif-containing protein 71
MTRRFTFAALVLPCSLLSSMAGAQTFITAWGSYGSGDGQFLTPYGVAISGIGEVYVSDGEGHRVQVFSNGGSYLRQWSTPGFAPNIAVDANDNVYVTGPDFNVIKYTSTGILVTQWGGFGSGPGQFGSDEISYFCPAVDAEGNVYVADRGNNRVEVFTPLGAYVREWPATNPDGLAVDAAGNVYTADFDNSRIQKFSNAGALITTWGQRGTGNGQFNGPVRVAIGPDGNVYVADWGNSRVQVFTADGIFFAKWGSSGTAPGQFLEPIGITVDAQGCVYVADKNNSRIQKFGPAPTTAVQSLTWGGLKSRYRRERGAAQNATQGR